MINSFTGRYRFLSNFWMLAFEVYLPDDPTLGYPSTEHAYQAAKTNDLTLRRDILLLSPGGSKSFGRHVKMRPDWDTAKLGIMEHLLRQKFAFTPASLAQRLDDTGDAELIEGNTWNDTYWGVCRGRGENHLGRLLMQIRTDNRTKSGALS